jgi:hypothetical protein
MSLTPIFRALKIHHKFSWLYCSLSLIVFSLQSAFAAPPSIENFYSKEPMKNACSKAELNRIHTEVIAIAGKKAPKLAWRLIKEMLCGTTTASLKYVRANSYDSILFEDFTQTDDATPTYSYISSKNLTPTKGEAWDTNIIDLEGNIGVLYDMGGVCISGFDIHFDTNKWKISKATIACD